MSKLKSRKFFVWIVSTSFLLMSFVIFFISQNDKIIDVLKVFAESWGWISAIYIGGNVIQKFSDKVIK